MVECLLILFILFLFILPIPTLALALGVVTSHLLYKKFLLFRYQPTEGKRLLWLTMLCGTINLILSLVLALAMASVVYYLLTDLFWLLAFNFLFCALIAIRWFDFTHRLYRTLVARLLKQETRLPDSTFVVILGLKKSFGWGSGWTPIFLDSGDLRLSQTTMTFNGTFLHLDLKTADIKNATPFSSERITLTLKPGHSPYQVDTYWIVVRDQFYPFKSRQVRDDLLAKMNAKSTPPAPGTNPDFSSYSPHPS